MTLKGQNQIYSRGMAHLIPLSTHLLIVLISANAHGTSELMLSPNDKEPRAMGADPGAGGSQQIIQNSHKFGAAATEFYFLQLCGKRKDDRV